MKCYTGPRTWWPLVNTGVFETAAAPSGRSEFILTVPNPVRSGNKGTQFARCLATTVAILAVAVAVAAKSEAVLSARVK
jgi:hypothetical protein